MWVKKTMWPTKKNAYGGCKLLHSFKSIKFEKHMLTSKGLKIPGLTMTNSINHIVKNM